MNRKEKLIARFLGMPSDFHYDEVVRLLGYFDFEEVAASIGHNEAVSA